MTASDRIAEEFNRLLGFGHKRMAERPHAEQVIYYLVIARCEKDMAGFDSIFEQGLTKPELRVLIDALRNLDETGLADEFARAVGLLQQEGFYPRRDLNVLSSNAKAEIAAIGKRVDDRLWDLDEKLVTLLETHS